MRKSCWSAVLLFALLVLTASGAYAQLTLSLVEPHQAGYPGQTLTYSAVITNIGAVPLSVDQACLTSQTPFDASWDPYVSSYLYRNLAPGEVWQGPVFDLFVERSWRWATRPEVFEISWWHDDLLSSSRVYYNADVLPEPSGIMALVTGLGILVLRRKRAVG